MKQIYFLLFALLFNVISGFGQQCSPLPAIYDNTYEFNYFTGYTFGNKITVTEVAHVTHLSAYSLAFTPNALSIALYSDLDNAPNTQLAKITNLPVSSSVGLHEYALNTPVLIQPGNYWVVFQVLTTNSDNRFFYSYTNPIHTDGYFQVLNNSIDMLLPQFPLDRRNELVYFTINLSLSMRLDCTASTNDFNINTLSLYPNPAQDFIQIKGLDKATNYTIYNTLGSKVKKGSIDVNQQIITQELQSGVYLISLENKGSLKFIKK